jgi:hypothetical protein
LIGGATILGGDVLFAGGVVCHERHPRGMASTQLTRDANLDVDDRNRQTCAAGSAAQQALKRRVSQT